MPRIANYNDGFMRTATALKLMLGLVAEPQEPFVYYSQFGYYGYSIQLFPLHVEYLVDINSAIMPALPEFDANIIERWKLTNELLLEGFSSGHSIENRIGRQLPGLAALAAFPLLEEVARLISKAWDEDGKLTRNVSETEGIGNWTPDGTRKVRSYPIGSLIVSLSDKLQIMHKSLHPNLQKTIESLDQVLQRPQIVGMSQPMSPLYDRLKFFRDQWMHGRRYDGWEALLISLLLALLYFGIMRLRLAQEQTDEQHKV